MKSRLNADAIRYRAMSCWREILTSMGMEFPHSPMKHGPCPACGGKDRFRFDDKGGTGSHICSQCGAGDGFTLLMKCFDWSFPEALEAVARYLGVNATDTIIAPRAKRDPERQTADPKKQLCIESRLAESVRMDLPMSRYFKSRGLNDLSGNIPDSIRFHPGLPYWEQTEPGQWQQTATYPAMLGKVTDVAGNLVTLHRTYITEEGLKAPVPNPKKLMSPALPGSLRGCSIKLGTPADTLYLTEGVETGLAVTLSTGGVVWACVSAGLLELVEIPLHVTNVNIMADRDRSGTGEKSAHKLAQKLLRGRDDAIKVKVCLPPGEIPKEKKSIDWLDWYQRCLQLEVAL